jgi:hypothetical protein
MTIDEARVCLNYLSPYSSIKMGAVLESETLNIVQHVLDGIVASGKALNADGCALEAYPPIFLDGDTEEIDDKNKSNRLAFIQGYLKGDKLSGLSWEDIRLIINLAKNLEEELSERDEYPIDDEEKFYNTVLYMFNQKKNHNEEE